MKIKYPLPKTLEKYGLTKKDYRNIMVRQEYKCPVCGNLLAKRTNIDHAHVKGWAKMPSEERKLYVRGILDFF